MLSCIHERGKIMPLSHTHVCMYTHTHTYTHAHAQTHTHTHTYTHTHTHTHIPMYIRIQIYVCAYMCVYKRTPIPIRASKDALTKKLFPVICMGGGVQDTIWLAPFKKPFVWSLSFMCFNSRLCLTNLRCKCAILGYYCLS